MPGFKAIFWDNDGVLVNTEHLYFQANRETLASIGVELTTKLYHDLFLMQGRGAWHLAPPGSLRPEDISRLREQRNARYSELLQQEDLLIDGVKEVLQTLHGTYHMGIVTSSRKEHFEIIHRSTDILRYFEFVLTGENYTNLKPEPEPYLLALEQTGYHKDECVVIEDSQRGLIAAQRAGLQCIVIPHKLSQYGHFERAYRILNNISELPTALSQNDV